MAGGIARVVSRTFIARIERVKILYQVSRASVSTSWLEIAPQIWREKGFSLPGKAKGNTAAVTRVLSYMSLTFSHMKSIAQPCREAASARLPAHLPVAVPRGRV